MNEGPERIDYRETSDVTEVHAAIKREHRDPSAEVTPIPLWLTVVCGIVVCWAGAYLGVFHGGFSSNIYNEYESSPNALFPLPQKPGTGADAGATQSLAQLGKVVYGQCQPCHQGNGLGVPGQFPPLAKSEFVIGGEKRLLAVLLKGLQGPVTVDGKPYNGVMPPWEKTLSDKKLAAVATYIRTEWGNAASEISEAKVAAARKQLEAHVVALTEAQLLQIPADENLPDDASAAPAAASAQPSAATGSTAVPAPATVTAATPAAGKVSAPASAPTPATAKTPVAAPAIADPATLARGKQVYMRVCFACHQPTGMGLPPVFPPLNTEYVTGSPERFAAMIMKGNMGPMTINGKAYNNIMPGQEAMLRDEEIAAVMTYCRASFGNNAPPVSPQVVAAVRKKYADRKTPWTEPELKAFDGGAPAPGAPPAPSTPGAPSPAAPPPATPSPATPSPATPSPATPSPATPSPATPSPATPSPATPSPATPSPATPSPATPAPGASVNL